METHSSSSQYFSHSENYSEKNWPFRLGSENYSDYGTLEKSYSYLPTPKHKAKKVQSFGNYVEKYDWIECVSRSIPGKIYYYNMRSGCSTWNKPISRYVHVPRYVRKESNLSDTHCYLQSPSLIVSDDDDECCSGSSIKLQEKNRRREWILEQLYYSPRKTDNGYRKRSVKKLSDNVLNSMPDSSSSNPMYYNDKDDTRYAKGDEFIDSVGDNLSNFDEILPMNITKFLECNLSVYTEFERCLESRSTDRKLINNIYNQDESDSDVSSFVEYKENDTKLVHLVPRLKKIQYHDMLVKNIKKKQTKQRKSTKGSQNDLKKDTEKEAIQKPEKIICHMYGVTTVNYNYDTESQPNVNVCNLSDSTTVVSSVMKENHSRSSILKRFGRDDLDKIIPPPMLSDSDSTNSLTSSSTSSSSFSSSSSSSTSFTCDTCSSTSSTSTSKS